MSATRTYLSKARARHRELCDRARTLPPELQPIVSEALDEFVFALTMLEAGEMERWSGRTAEQPPRDVPAHAWADAMERLMREAAFYRALLTCTPVAVSLVSPDGFIRYSSPGVTTVLGFGPEELEGEDLFELIHPEDRPGARARCQRLLQDPERVEVARELVRRKDASWCVVEQVETAADPDSALTGVLIVTRRLAS